jgi:acetylornithine deacetylase/succinyl-diaminopimelate desuccinylase-like protein
MLAAERFVHAAFAWLHANPKTILDWQAEVCSIPAPSFNEKARGEWLAERFGEAGLVGIETDEVGNVLGFLPAPHLSAESTGPVVVISAHLDTVFPAETALHPVVRRVNGPGGSADRLEVPGASDNGAGIVGMLAIAHALAAVGAELAAPLVFLGNVGEEGEGDLRGVRHFYAQNKLAGRVAAHVVLDGAGSDGAVTQALGSRRFRVTVTGPGGHSFTDAGTPNPIAALANALAEVAETRLPPVDSGGQAPRTTLNLGTIHGGTSVNSIPERAAAAIDFRSTSADELVRLEVALYRAAEDAVERANRRAETVRGVRGRLAFEIERIGNRPAARLPEESALLVALRAVDRHLGLATSLRLGSTDANLPLSLGVQALSLGAGGDGGGAHTLAEWYEDRNREIALRRILLLVLAMTEWAAED